MAIDNPASTPLPAKLHPTWPSHPDIVAPQSAPDTDRRHSLPLHFRPPSLWSANTSSASLIQSDQAALGEHILDERTVANRISALRQLNGATKTRHRYAKSTGAQNSTFSQPVIVRTYSGPARPRSQKRDIVTLRKQNGRTVPRGNKMDVKLPPIEAFSFKGIMDDIRGGISEDLERIAEICARSKYSLSNQYEVHMPPHGRGDPLLVGTTAAGGGPTLQAIASDEEQTRSVGSRNRRRTKSVAYGTLETIMSSSKSSEEDKSAKKPAAVLAEEVRGRAKKHLELLADTKDLGSAIVVPTAVHGQRPVGHARSKSATFASIFIDNVLGAKNDISTHGSHLDSSVSLVSEPARPQTSVALGSSSAFESISEMSPTTMQPVESQKPSGFRNEFIASTLLPASSSPSTTLFSTLSSWLPWTQTAAIGTPRQNARRGSHAEGSLRELLRSTDLDRKGKGISRGNG